MKKNIIKDENYINIQGWMTKLKLSGNELIIYALIYGFSQLNDHSFHGSLQYICDWTNLSKQSCMDNLKRLVAKKYLIKKEKDINGVKFCEYSVNFTPIQDSCIGIQDSCIGIQESLPNNIEYNIEESIDNKLSIDESPEDDSKSKKDKILNESIEYIIDYLNKTTGKHFKPNSKYTVKLIKARFKDGFSIDDFYDVIDKKWNEWKNTDMEQYMQPYTLFADSHFESYLNQKKVIFRGKPKSSYGSKPTFDNTATHNVPKGIANMSSEEKEQFYNNELAKDENGNFLKF